MKSICNFKFLISEFTKNNHSMSINFIISSFIGFQLPHGNAADIPQSGIGILTHWLIDLFSYFLNFLIQ